MKVWLFICFIFILVLPSNIFVHSGGTDRNGGHNKKANGTYHCHSGPCLDDAWKEAYDKYFPIGQVDGKKRNDRSVAIETVLRKELDVDIAEYAVPYALKAYKMGNKDTYVPTFWDKYGWYIGGGTGIAALIGIFRFTANRKNKQVLQ